MLSRLLLPVRFLIQLLSNRLLLMRVLLLLVFVTFAVRLAFLQVWTGKELHDVSTRNHLRWVRFPAPRGMILDRKGRVLATSTESRAVWLVSGEVPRKGWDSLYQGLVNAGIFPNVESARAGLEETRKHPSYQPQRLMSDLDINLTTRIEEELAYLPGVYLNTEPTRSYPGGALAAHIIGYLSEIDEKKLVSMREDGYRAGDRVGKTGIEAAFEDILHGQEGGEQLEVDVSGRVLHRYERTEPQAGGNITLTIDLDIQRAAEEGLKGLEGAVVVLDPHTGDVLAIASTPAYDLNQMSTRITTDMMEEFQQNHAMENRATSSYPPGSVFKIITAASALEKNVIPADASYYCDGSYFGIKCWKHDGHQSLSLTGAIAQSCNVAFMKIAEQVGPNDMLSMGHRFGLGQKVGMGDFLPQVAGNLPDTARKNAGVPWQLGDTLNIGIGQGRLLVTPLQSSRIIAAFANGGLLVTPRLVDSIGDEPQRMTSATTLGLSNNTMERINQGLRAVASEGTAKHLDQSLHIAAKTGTAQNPGGIDHAWFVGYAPYEKPTIAVAVLVVHGGHGAENAAPIAQMVIRAANGEKVDAAVPVVSPDL